MWRGRAIEIILMRINSTLCLTLMFGVGYLSSCWSRGILLGWTVLLPCRGQVNLNVWLGLSWHGSRAVLVSYLTEQSCAVKLDGWVWGVNCQWCGDSSSGLALWLCITQGRLERLVSVETLSFFAQGLRAAALGRNFRPSWDRLVLPYWWSVTVTVIEGSTRGTAHSVDWYLRLSDRAMARSYQLLDYGWTPLSQNLYWKRWCWSRTC
jgi:hypothetical protein